LRVSRDRWSVLTVTLCTQWTSATTFDSETLRLRGIDPGLAAYLGQVARFTEGVQAVRLFVNGQPKGIFDARFDATGALCIDQALREAAQLVETQQGCGEFTKHFPETLVEALPQTGEVKLLVPARALRRPSADLSGFSQGGGAGLFNYDVQGLYNRFEGRHSQFLSANTEVGFNAGDWVLRSRQFYSSVQGNAAWQHLEAYAQRTFSDHQAMLQVGQINLDNPVLAGLRVTGAQWSSETALADRDNAPPVQGIATTQARVDIRQAGMLIYSTVVPAGPFGLTHIPRLNRRQDVEVTVIEANGERRSFTVLAATLGLNLPSRGFTLGLGQLRSIGRGDQQPWALSAGGSLPLAAATSFSGGAQLAEGYGAGGAGLNLQPWSHSRLQSLLQVAHADEPSATGLLGSVSLNQQLTAQWSGLLSASRQTQGYRELIDTVTRRSTQSSNRLRDQYATGLIWSRSWLGSLSGTYSTTTTFDGSRSARAQLNWTRRLGPVSLTTTGQWQTAGRGRLGNALYLSASLPLGDGLSWRTTARRDASAIRLGSGVQGRLGQQTGYRLAAERSGRNGQTTYSGGISRLTRAAQFDLGYAGYGHGSQGYSAAARGALVVHENGITLSPYPLQDTFGLISLGTVPGVRIDTPGGAVWTDRQGRAVLPQLTPFGRSSVQVATASLPRNVDVQQGTAIIQVGRGAVPRVSFPVTVTRRLLLQVLDDAGRRLQPGTAVIDEQGQLVTLVQADGAVFVPNVYTSPRLWARTADGQPCELHFALPDAVDPDAYFENAQTRCSNATEVMK
jgi:outer membrane usher protein FimD/PapC